MPQCLTIAPHLPQHELATRDRHSRNPVEHSHWHIVWLVAVGHHCPAVARLIGYAEDWVRTIIHRSNGDGPDVRSVGGRDWRRPGPDHPIRPRRLLPALRLPAPDLQRATLMQSALRGCLERG